MLRALFSRKPPELLVDFHSHLLPGIDDGVRSFEESIEILQRFQRQGYKKVITTPHISEQFRNTPEIIENLCSDLQTRAERAGLTIKVACAAEYKVDPTFLDKLKSEERLLTFGDKYLLFETSFHSKPMFFDEAVFEMQSRGYKPVFAHPERYHYLEDDLSWIKSVRERGVHLQMNLMSMAGVYGKEAERRAKTMLKEGLISFVGSDLHRIKQWQNIETALNQKLGGYTFLNKQLI
ncbi:tyrosine-protein phosphatase [Marinoscillum sp. MHG1-6]|uniref:tyrosine-protein phosphatase n=1 Tax=Marinoscillum sp. MHG1-6 TaxID=2959627 RepID=UPI0021579E19|nr:CpsB/CapC family capsule biosynthesis tyrosine phosphatase [Marinoscillum sp. MHG1-6]